MLKEVLEKPQKSTREKKTRFNNTLSILWTCSKTIIQVLHIHILENVSNELYLIRKIKNLIVFQCFIIYIS